MAGDDSDSGPRSNPMAATFRESPSSRRAHATEGEARQRLFDILDGARTFEELSAGITAAHDATESHPDFGHVQRFLIKRDPSGLDPALQERLAQVLSRMVESTEALALAGVLESSGD